MRVLVIESEKETKRFPNVEERAEGTLWSKSFPLINGAAASRLGLSKDQISAEIKAGRASNLPAEIIFRLGENEGGYSVMWLSDYEAKQAAAAKAAEAAKTPAQKEREAIDALYRRANAAEYASDDDNVDRYYELKGEADRRLKAWKTANPKLWALEQAEKLELDANEIEAKAPDALLYDADGSISYDDQRALRDKEIAKAQELRDQAAKLRASAEGN